MTVRILVLDDSAISRDIVRDGLRGAGWEPVVAQDLAGLNEALASGAFQAGVIDLEMPEAYGDDVLEFLREGKGFQAPLVLYSDFDPVMLASRANAVHAHAWVTKAEGVPRLIEALKGLLAPPASEPDGKPRVMIVDDSEMTAKLIQAELDAKNFQVILADSADKAARLILRKQTRPQLILLDVNMPNVDGASFCRFIKGNSLFKGIKVVLCSGMEPEKLREIAATCGADGFVPKDSFLSRWVLEEIRKAERAAKGEP